MFYLSGFLLSIISFLPIDTPNSILHPTTELSPPCFFLVFAVSTSTLSRSVSNAVQEMALERVDAAFVILSFYVFTLKKCSSCFKYSDCAHMR